MYRYACRDVGVDCDFITMAETAEEVKEAAFAHGGVVHREVLESMTQEQLAELERAVDAAIKPV